MNTGPSWHFTRPWLTEALDLWKESGPSPAMVEAVNDGLMDLIQDPKRWGTEDPNVPGVYHRSIKMPDGQTIGVLYAIPDESTGEVGVADIRTGS